MSSDHLSPIKHLRGAASNVQITTVPAETPRAAVWIAGSVTATVIGVGGAYLIYRLSKWFRRRRGRMVVSQLPPPRRREFEIEEDSESEVSELEDRESLRRSQVKMVPQRKVEKKECGTATEGFSYQPRQFTHAVEVHECPQESKESSPQEDISHQQRQSTHVVEVHEWPQESEKLPPQEGTSHQQRQSTHVVEVHEWPQVCEELSPQENTSHQQRQSTHVVDVHERRQESEELSAQEKHASWTPEKKRLKLVDEENTQASSTEETEKVSADGTSKPLKESETDQSLSEKEQKAVRLLQMAENAGLLLVFC